MVSQHKSSLAHVSLLTFRIYKYPHRAPSHFSDFLHISSLLLPALIPSISTKMRCPSISTALTFVYCGLVTLSAAAVLPPSENENHLTRRGNSSTLSTKLKTNTLTMRPGNMSTSSTKLKTNTLTMRPGNMSTSSTKTLKTSTLNTNPKVGGWCTFHLTYSVSAQLGISR